MFDSFVKECASRGIKNIKGKYLKSAKNNMVEGLYSDLGFKQIDLKPNADSDWLFEIPSSYKQKNKCIEVLT